MNECDKCGKRHERCSGHKKRTTPPKPCMRHPKAGSKACRVHGGAASQVVAAGERRVREMEVEAALTEYGMPVNTPWRELVVEEIAHAAGAVAFCRARAKSTDADGLVRGTRSIRRTTGTGPSGSYVDMTVTEIGPQTNPWLDRLDRERRHLLEWTTLAHRVGVDEHQIKLAEDQGMLVADAIQRILAALDLTPEQEDRVPEVVSGALRLVGGMAG